MADGQGRSSEQGVKLLYIRDYLHKYTNKEHPKSAKDIIEYLASKGIKAERKTIYNALLEAGYRIFDWNALNNDCLLHTRPADQSDLDFMKESFIETIAYSFRLKSAPHIILMHDSYAQTAELLPWIIEYLQDLGCTFGTPDELPAGWHY